MTTQTEKHEVWTLHQVADYLQLSVRGSQNVINDLIAHHGLGRVCRGRYLASEIRRCVLERSRG